MAGYTQLTEEELVWRENRERVSLQGRQILRRVMDVVLTELDEQFNAAQLRGEVLKITADEDSLKELLLNAANKQLGAGNEVSD